MSGVIFILVLAFVWLAFAAIADLRKTEIPNWLNFSLVIFALGFRFFYSLFDAGNFSSFYQGLIGFVIFLVFGNLFYYGRIFAGGDAKLMMALGAVIPFSSDFYSNIQIYLSFLILFLIAGSLYGLVASGYFAAKNAKSFRKEFVKRYREGWKLNVPVMAAGIALMLFGFWQGLLFYTGILIFLFPILYVYSNSVDEACMVRRVSPEKLMEGDWLYKDVKIGKKTIEANWDGLSKSNIALLRKSRKEVTVRYGIAFAPVFLISFASLVYVYFINTGLWNSFW